VDAGADRRGPPGRSVSSRCRGRSPARAVLDSLGADAVEVRTPTDLDGVDRLVMPGGESTTMSMLLEDGSGLFDDCATGSPAGMPVFGTCAGMILLALGDPRRAGRPAQLRAIDIDGAPQRVRPPGRQLRDRPRRRRGPRRVTLPRRVHPGPR
jgi:hypothetical protein